MYSVSGRSTSHLPICLCLVNIIKTINFNKYILAPVSAAPSGIPVPLALPAAGSSSATPDIPVSAPPTVKKPSYRLAQLFFYSNHKG